MVKLKKKGKKKVTLDHHPTKMNLRLSSDYPCSEFPSFERPPKNMLTVNTDAKKQTSPSN